MFEPDVIRALVMTTFAGLATTVGSIIGLAVKKPGNRMMSFTLGFSAGVMVFVSFVELLPGGVERVGILPGYMAFFAGMLCYFLIDVLVPHDYVGQHDHSGSSENMPLKRTGLLIALGVGIHNFPEGMATFAGSLQSTHLGAALAVAIAIHNIPEGLAVSAPVFAATGSRGKAFLWSFLSGVSEPLGALLVAVFLMPYLTTVTLGYMITAVAGIMVAISLDEIIPVAKSFDAEHIPIIGIILGMAVMAASLWMLR